MNKIAKKDLNQNIHLSEGNIKSKCTNDTMFLTWSLPSQSTCPYATAACKKRCFAKKNESFKTVRDSRSRNLAETYKDTFVPDMIKHFEYNLQRPKAQDKLIIVRIHTSGDFYNKEYFNKWVDIANHFKGNNKILFQAYTKSMPILKEYIEDNKIRLEDINIHFVWSIWHDTPVEYTEHAKYLNMQTFTALPKEEIEAAVRNGAFLCEGDCGNCKECYTGKSKEIVIPYH
jgi:hypothetical protein